MCNMHYLDLEFLWQVEEHPEDSAIKLVITLHQERENTEEEQKPIEEAEWEQRTEYIRLMGEEPMKTKWA
jgi:cell division protein FtsL